MSEKIQTDSTALDYRIYVHDNFAEKDIDPWVLDHLSVKPGMSVLDIGCGSGKHLFKLSSLVENGTVIGTDISDVSLAKCQERIDKESHKNITIQNIDLTQLQENLSDKKFDRILASFSIYYTKNPEKTFNDIFNLLKPGGILFVCGPTAINNKAYLDVAQEAGMTFSQEFVECSKFLNDKAKDLLNNLFGNVDVSMFENRISFPTESTVMKYWSSTPLYDKSLESNMEKSVNKAFEKTRPFVTTKVVIGLKSIKDDPV
ncbi:hypothetical protein CL622_02390 [archaeon]|nr:hypothetical protein [archaeon]